MDAFLKIKKIVLLLERVCGKPRLFPRSNPVDELIRTVLLQNTSDANSLAAYAVLKKAFSTWDKALAAPTATIARLIQHAGLANIKARRIKDVLGEIKRREGKISLAHLGRLGPEEATAYLRSLKGVGPKTAACVLLFSFRKPAMPVDTHIFRVTQRLGLIGPKVTAEAAHGIFAKLIPNHLKYVFHLVIIEHGRKTCKAQNPRCGSCVLYGLCAFNKKKDNRCRRNLR